MTHTKVPAGVEVATRRSTAQDEEISFTTDEELIIAPPRLVHVRVENEFNNNQLENLKKWRKIDSERKKSFQAFRRKSQKESDTYQDTAFYLGFDQDISGYILQLKFKCVRAAGGTGIDGRNPPLVWEASMGEAFTDERQKWQRAARKSADTTEGLNRDGQIELHLPLSMKAACCQMASSRKWPNFSARFEGAAVFVRG